MTKNKITQWSVPLSNEPGTLSKLSKTLGEAEINITAFSSESFGDVAYFRFLTENDNGVRSALEDAGYQAFESPAIEVKLPNRPGELFKLSKTLGEKGINILNSYASATQETADGRVVLVVDSPEKAWPLLAKWAYPYAKSPRRELVEA